MKGVAATSRQGLHTVALKRLVGGITVGAAAQGFLERGPLLGRKVVVDVIHPTPTFVSRPRSTCPIGRHDDDARSLSHRLG